MAINEYLHHLVDRRGSDLHLKAGSPPIVRVDGVLYTTDFAPLSPGDVEATARQIMPEPAASEFSSNGEADFAYSVDSVGRFRVNVFRQRGSVGIAIRWVPSTPPTLESLGMPPIVRKLAEERRGLLLVTGPSGSGKTMTTGAIVNHVNVSRRVHIVTIEDPIEILHEDRAAIVNQREVGLDTQSFGGALRRALRQDPDVIFIGEIRDIETVRAALQAAETGHLVISTLHTTDVAETVNRVVDFFPPHQQKQIRYVLADTLIGVVSQRLLPRADGRGRVAAVEVLVMNGRIHDLIASDQQAGAIREIIAEGQYYGMQTFDQALIALVKSGFVTLEEGAFSATNRHDFSLMLRQEGVVA